MKLNIWWLQAVSVLVRFIFLRLFCISACVGASVEPQQLPFPVSSRATHASSGSDTHHLVTHSVLTPPTRTSYSFHTKYKFCSDHISSHTQQHWVTKAPHCFFPPSLLHALAHSPWALSAFIHTVNLIETGDTVNKERPLKVSPCGSLIDKICFVNSSVVFLSPFFEFSLPWPNPLFTTCCCACARDTSGYLGKPPLLTLVMFLNKTLIIGIHLSSRTGINAP